MSIHAFPNLGGIKLRGTNVPPPPMTPSGPSTIFYDWWYPIGTTGVSHAYWSQWTVPAMDAAVSVGCNAVAIIFDQKLRVGGGTTLTHGQWVTLLTLLFKTAAGKGLWVLPCLAHAYYVNIDTISTANIQSYLDETAAIVSGFSNCIAINAMVEYEIGTPTSQSYLNPGAWITAAKAGRVRSSIKVSISTVLTAGSTPAASVGQAIITAGGEFVAVDLYHNIPAGDFDTWLFNAGGGASGTTDWPFLVGECGAPQSEGSLATWYTNYAALANHRRVQGAFQWATVTYDVTSSNDYGMFDETQNGAYVFTDPRSNMTTPWQTIAKETQACDSAQDNGPTITSAPTVSWGAAGVVTLTWAAATGGSTTTKTYTPQYATADADGFPTQDWQSRSPISGLTDTFTLSTNTLYVFRVLVSAT